MSELTVFTSKKYDNLNQIEQKYNTTFDAKYNIISDTILDIFNNDCANINNYNLSDVLVLSVLGYYYKHVKKDFNEMKKYYMLAIDLKNSSAMNNLGHYYESIEKYDEMTKWYTMAIKNNNSNAMNNLGYHYENIENYDEMKKLYLMAIDLKNVNAMYNLAYHYEHTEINHDEMKKWYIMAINLCDVHSFNRMKKFIDVDKQYDILKNIKYKTKEFEHIYINLRIELCNGYIKNYNENIRRSCVIS